MSKSVPPRHADAVPTPLPTTVRPPMDPVCIVGAGPAGLASAVALKKEQIPFQIVDAGRDVGGIWDIDRPETPMYRSAHFISSRSLSGFPGFPMPESYPDYPRHDLVLRYIRSFAEHHGLLEDGLMETRVVRASPSRPHEPQLSPAVPGV